MKTFFKSLSLLFVLAITSAFLGAADEGKSIPYTATVTGVVCSSCKAHVTAAFKKLPGVTEVRFARGEKEGTQVLSFNAATSNLAKEDIVKTLGEDASRYEVLSVEKAAH